MPKMLTAGLARVKCAAEATSPEMIASKAQAAVPEMFRLPDGNPDYLRLILTSKVYDALEETPLTHAVNLSARLKCNVFLKREDRHPGFTFKLRGAYNKMANLNAQERSTGVVTCSNGSHAQSVAYSGRELKIPATVVMPLTTTENMHKRVSELGGLVVSSSAESDDMETEAAKLEEAYGLVNVPRFDDPYIIAGQGTVGMEILRQTSVQNLEAIFCCVGGGGLIAGIGSYVKRIAPHVKIIGVETYDASPMVKSLQSGKRATLNDVGIFADGVKTVGEECYRLCKEVIDQVIQVTTDEACAAIKDIFEDTRSIVEPAGALTVAGLKKYVTLQSSRSVERKFVAIASGSNIDFESLRFVVERTALGENKEALLSIIIDEKPGAFAELVQKVHPFPITELTYRHQNGLDNKAFVFMSVTFNVSTRTRDLKALKERLETDGTQVNDLSGDELSKSHLRYLAGGRSNVKHEHLYSFTFPERLGALKKFVTALQPGFIITLFHYRDYGSDIARILAGIQARPCEKFELENFLRDIGYPYREETTNSTYQEFLLE